MNSTGVTSSAPPLCYFRQDVEQRFGISAGSGTSVNAFASGLLAVLATAALYATVMSLPPTFFSRMLLERGPTQHAAVLLGFWCAAILTIKWLKLRLQRQALRYSVVPDAHDFVLTSQTADQAILKVRQTAADPERFIAFNRILIAIANLKNLGRVSDVDEILNSCAERDESAHETSFSLITGFLWAIPVLGFIGTVLGLSQAIGRFGDMLGGQSEVQQIVGSLKEITGGLSTAFETTLLALVIALFIQLWMTFQKKAEEEFLDQCSQYCMEQIVSRVKILPYEQTREA